MMIALEKGLEELKPYFAQRGYQVVELDSTSRYDVVIYQNTSVLSIPTPSQSSVKAGLGAGGVFLICAKGRTADEIETILRQKSYNNLF